MTQQFFSFAVLGFLLATMVHWTSVTVAAQENQANQVARKFDEFGPINCEDELARLDNFAIELQNNPQRLGYIIIYGGRTGRRNEAKARAARMNYYLVHTRGLARNRIITIDGGFRETLMGELWVSPVGGSAPSPAPTLRPADVKLKGRVRVHGYDCGAGLGDH